jgi:hypothetical protein
MALTITLSPFLTGCSEEHPVVVKMAAPVKITPVQLRTRIVFLMLYFCVLL